MRGRDSSDGKHWSASEPFGSRAFFRVGTNPTFLLINDVTPAVRDRVNGACENMRALKIGHVAYIRPKALIDLVSRRGG